MRDSDALEDRVSRGSGTEVLGVVRITYPKSVVDSRVNENLRGIFLQLRSPLRWL